MPIPVTHDKTLRDRVDELVPLAFNRLRKEADQEISSASINLAARGLFHSGAAVSQVHNICVQQVGKRTDEVWKILQRVMDAVSISYSDTLRQDLKTYFDYYVPASLWELPGLYERMGGKALYDQSFAALLLQERAEQLKRIHVEIDLYVDRLQAQARKSVAVPGKERDQKFGILLSPKQAVLDFDEWKGRLKAGASIAVLFLDIDNFKEQNTHHTEAVVDKTLLPDVLSLLADVVDQRGAAYQQGGDEFVLILPNYDKTEAVAFAEKVRSRIASHNFQVGEQAESLTISGGVALWPEHGATYDDVLAKANLANREAKEKRNKIILFSHADRVDYGERQTD